MSIRQNLVDLFGEDSGLLFLDPPEHYDHCVIGVVERANCGIVVAYDEVAVLKSLEAQGMTEDEAQEFFSFNILGSRIGDKTPVFLLHKDSLQTIEPE